MQKSSFAVVLGFLLALSAPAHAQSLGQQGAAVFAAERLFGVRGERVHLDLPAPAPDQERTYTVLSLGFGEHFVPYDIPRVAFDYLVVDKVSVGGAIGFLSAEQATRGQGSATTNTFLFAPRAGFLHMFGRVAGIWPRAGFTYHRQSVEDEYVESGLGLDLECQFPIALTEHFGLLLGLAFDHSLLASRDPEQSVELDVTYRSVGLHVGLFGWL